MDLVVAAVILAIALAVNFRTLPGYARTHGIFLTVISAIVMTSITVAAVALGVILWR